MSDERNRSANPWMRPMGAQQLIRGGQTRRPPEPVSLYTPNEPDQNEAIYAARAVAARQQAMTRQTAQPLSPVQLAVEQAAQEAHAARQMNQPPTDRYAYAPQPVQPAAVFYQQSTGVVGQEPPAAPQPARPAQPHRLPMDAYPAATGSPEAAGMAYAAPSRQVDDAVLADSMLMEAEQAASPRRRRMVMRQEQERAVPQQEAAPAAQPAAEDASMERIPAMPQLSVAPTAFFPAAEAADVPVAETMAEAPAPAGEPLTKIDLFADPLAAASAPLPGDAVPDPQPDPQPEIPTQPEPLLDPANPPSEFFELPLENPLKGFDWYAEDVLEEDDDPEDDCMDTSSMPIPAPVSTLDIPKVRRGKRLFTLLLVLMLLAAAGAFLWLSGYGEKLYDHAVRLVDSIQNPTVSTGKLTISPESAGVPAILTISVTTDSDITALRLIDDKEQELPAQILSRAEGEKTLWTGSLTMQQAYNGFVRTQLLCGDGQWRTGSEKKHVQLN